MSAAARAAVPVPPKCDGCDEQRQVELPDGKVGRCPTCHPLTHRSLTALIDERTRLQSELKRVDEAIAAATEQPAPGWARGPGSAR